MSDDRITDQSLTVLECRLLKKWIGSLIDFIDDEYVIADKADRNALMKLMPKLKRGAAVMLPSEVLAQEEQNKKHDALGDDDA